jgi:hypothetical protein
MRSIRLTSLIFAWFLLTGVITAHISSPPIPSQPQIGSPGDTTSTASSTKDPQAVSVLTQSLTAVGGIPAILAITDYTATGNVTYHWGDDVQGSVTVRGSASGQFRLDANLPTGLRSEAINGESTIKTPDGILWQPHDQAPMSPSRLVLPYLLASRALNSPAFNLLDKGIVQLEGHSVHDIQLQRFLPGVADPDGRFREYFTVDFFIDASTFQVLMTQEVIAPNRLVRQIRYSDYRTVRGLLVPFSISEQVIDHPTWLIQLDQINFNTGLSDSDFQL